LALVATAGIESGPDGIEVRDILGNVSWKTTSRYLDGRASRLRGGVAAQVPRCARTGL